MNSTNPFPAPSDNGAAPLNLPELNTKLLNDDRAVVRGWAVEAFQFTLRRELAQPALQAARAGLKFDDTKRAVDEVLQEWSKAGGK